MKRTILLLAILGICICKFSFAQEKKDEPFVVKFRLENDMPLSSRLSESRRHANENKIEVFNPTIGLTALTRIPVLQNNLNIRCGYMFNGNVIRRLVGVNSLSLAGVEIQGYTIAVMRGIVVQEKYHDHDGMFRGNSRNFVRKEVTGLYVESTDQSKIGMNIVLFSGKTVEFYRILATYQAKYKTLTANFGVYSESYMGSGLYVELPFRNSSLFVARTFFNNTNEERGIPSDAMAAGILLTFF